MKKMLLSLLAALFLVTPAAADVARVTDSVAVEVVRAPEVLAEVAKAPSEEVLKIKGVYHIQVVRDGKIVEDRVDHNLITTQGKRYLLDAGLDNSAGGLTLQAAWYVALVSTNTAPAAGMTYAAPVYTEFTTYSEANRVTWNGVVDGSAGSITNSASKASFTASGSATIYGASLVSGNTKGDTAAAEYLFSYSLFSSPINVVAGDVINVTITITLT